MKTLIVYEDGRPELERVARSIGESLDPERHAPKLLPASAVTIPEILASGLFFFGAAEPRSPAYAEIVRVLAGINLAGRKAAYYGSSGSAVAWLREIAADSELGTAGPDYVAAKADGNALAAWLRTVV